MTRRNEGRRRAEEGYSLLEFPPFLLVILVFLCLFTELGSFGYTALAADNASYAASRALAQDTSLSEEAVLAEVLKASPSLSDDDVVVESSVSAKSKEAYVHHAPAQSGFEERASYAVSRDVAVTVTVSYEPLSWLGAAMAEAMGGDNLEVSSTHTALADATIEGGASEW